MTRRQKLTLAIASDRLHPKLVAGYKAMAKEDRETAEDRVRSGSENLDPADPPCARS